MYTKCLLYVKVILQQLKYWRDYQMKVIACWEGHRMPPVFPTPTPAMHSHGHISDVVFCSSNAPANALSLVTSAYCFLGPRLAGTHISHYSLLYIRVLGLYVGAAEGLSWGRGQNYGNCSDLNKSSKYSL